MIPGLVNKKLLKMAIEIVDLLIKDGDVPSFFVCLPGRVMKVRCRKVITEGQGWPRCSCLQACLQSVCGMWQSCTQGAANNLSGAVKLCGMEKIVVYCGLSIVLWYTIYHHLPAIIIYLLLKGKPSNPSIFINQPMGKGHLCCVPASYNKSSVEVFHRQKVRGTAWTTNSCRNEEKANTRVLVEPIVTLRNFENKNMKRNKQAACLSSDVQYEHKVYRIDGQKIKKNNETWRFKPPLVARIFSVRMTGNTV